MATENICVAFTEKKKLSNNWKIQLMTQVGYNLNQHTKVNVHIFYGDIGDLLLFFVENYIISTKSKVQIMTKPNLMYLDSVLHVQNGMMNLFEGSFSFSKKRDILGFKYFLDALIPSQYPSDLYFHKFWVDNFYCLPPPLLCGNHKPCPLNLSLKTKQEKNIVMITSKPSFSIQNAVYALVHALHKVLWRNIEIESQEVSNQDRLQPWQVSLPHKQGEIWKLTLLQVIY